MAEDKSKISQIQPDSDSMNISDNQSLERRDFFKLGALGVLFLGGSAAALEPLRHFKSESGLEDWMQQQYERLSPETMEKILRRLEEKTKKQYDAEVHIQDVKPLPGVQYAYALNIGRCIGCRRCVHACVGENNQSRDPAIQYIRVLEMPNGTLDAEQSNHYYDHPQVPVPGEIL